MSRPAAPKSKSIPQALDSIHADAIATGLHNKRFPVKGTSKGGRPRARLAPREPGETATFVFNEHTSSSGPRVVAEVRIGMGTSNKASVRVPRHLVRRIQDAVSGPWTVGLTVLADYGLQRLEQDGRLIHVATEISEHAFVPDKSLDESCGKRDKAQLKQAMTQARERLMSPDGARKEARRWAERVFESRADARVKEALIERLTNALEDSEGVIQQLLDLLSLDGVRQAQKLGLTKRPRVKTLVDELRREVERDLDLGAVARSVLPEP
ncbi:MAG: hypothetical protein ACXIUZ_00625 [Lysobacteraceae bacterium]